MIIFYILLGALTFRIRGGLRIKNKKIPLNKWWFAIAFAFCAKYLLKTDWNTFTVILIAAKMSTSICGWGEACGCALGVGKPSKDRVDNADFDEFCDNFEFKGWKLIEHPICWGVVWLTLRGVLLSFIIGLALNNIPYMITGAGMGLIYYLCGLFARKVLKKADKTGWNISEWVLGGILMGVLYLIGD